MLGNLAVVLILAIATVLLGWLVWRSWRASRLPVRVAGVVLWGLLALVFGLITGVMAVGALQIYGSRGNPVPNITVAGTPEQVARGEHLANMTCASCHTMDGRLPMSGGKDIGEQIPLPLGRFVPANLTPAGSIADWTDGELVRAIREGTDARGHLLPIKSSMDFHHLGEEDLNALVAYIRSQPPVETDLPRSGYTPLALVMAALGMLPIGDVPDPEMPTAPLKAATAAYGDYVAAFMGCSDCHGLDMTGGGGGLYPEGPTLRVVKAWTEEQFAEAMRTGVSPTRGPLDPAEKPLEGLGKMDDDELAALHQYLIGLD